MYPVIDASVGAAHTEVDGSSPRANRCGNVGRGAACDNSVEAKRSHDAPASDCSDAGRGVQPTITALFSRLRAGG